jgi:MFS family permease
MASSTAAVVVDDASAADRQPRGCRPPTIRVPRWSPKVSFVVVAATLAVLVGGSNIPTPLFPLYRREYHFGSATLTFLFCTYVFALIPALLTLGRLSDRAGRRPVIVSGLALTALSSLAFACAHGVVWLFAGEALYGVASGLVSSGAAAALRELHVVGDPRGSALGASLAPAIGLVLGPAVSGALAVSTPWPAVSPYVVDVVLVGVLVAAMAGVPETRPLSAGPQGRHVVHLPREGRSRFARAAAVSFVGWAVTGWVLALSALYLADELHVHSAAASGAVAALFFIASGCAQLVVRRWREPMVIRVALALEVAGMSAVLLAVPSGSVAVLVAAVILAGCGQGGILVSTMAIVLADADPSARGGVTSTLYVVNYLGLGVPVLACGLVAGRVGLVTSTSLFVVFIAVISAAALWLRVSPLAEELESL